MPSLNTRLKRKHKIRPFRSQSCKSALSLMITIRSFFFFLCLCFELKVQDLRPSFSFFLGFFTAIKIIPSMPVYYFWSLHDFPTPCSPFRVHGYPPFNKLLLQRAVHVHSHPFPRNQHLSVIPWSLLRGTLFQEPFSSRNRTEQTNLGYLVLY